MLGKFIVFVIVASIVVCSHIQTIAADDFTLNQFIGMWHDLGSISANDDVHEIHKCIWMNITKRDDGDENFNQVYGFTVDGNPRTILGHGRIANSVVRIEFPTVPLVATYTVTSYNNGQELTAFDENENIYGLLSRSSTFSAGTKAEFDKLAKNKGLSAVYFNRNNCS